MKYRVLMVLAACCALVAQAQIVTTSPVIVQTDTKGIVITFNAGEGNKGLAGLTASTPVYAHTGVIMSSSASQSDWKYAPVWGDNSAKYAMTYVGPDIWTLSIPDINSYYGVPASETVKELAFVFRNADGSREGKTADGGDIFVKVYPAGFQVVVQSSLSGSVITDNSPVTFTATTTAPANITLTLSDGTKLASVSNSTSLSAQHTFPAMGDYTVTATAVPVAGGADKKSSVTVVRVSDSMPRDYPGGTPVMGAVDNPDGSVTFCICAPGKKSMILMPSWNGYHASSSTLMNYQDYNGFRYFWITVPGLEKGKDYFYYYLADGSRAVGDPYARLVLDPYSDRYIPSGVFPALPSYPVAEIPYSVPLAWYNSDMDEYEWQVSDFKGVKPEQLVIYELLIRDFTGTDGEALGSGTVNGVIKKLDYIKSLGVNAVELLPIMEFNGNNSWGYNTNFYFAPDKAYGTPDDYRRLIDECHARGLAVILDIVFNQSDGLHPWYQLYDISVNPFYNGSAPHSYSVLNDWKQENPVVQQQWRDVLEYWLTAYKVDGFRFDLVKGLGNSDSYGTAYNSSTNTYAAPSDANTDKFNASRVARMKELHAVVSAVNPDAYFINENLAGAQEENEMAKDGELNWANINAQATAFACGTPGGSFLNRFYALDNDGRLRGSTVSYVESHDEERVAYKMANDPSVSSTIRNSLQRQMLRLGSLAAQMLMTPGAHMIWQFEELGADQTTKNSNGNNTDPKTVVWNYLDNEYRAGLKDTYAALCAVREAAPELFGNSSAVVMNCDTESWATPRTIKLTSGDTEIVCIINCNITPTSRTYDVPVSFDASRYRLLASSHATSPVLTSDKKVTLAGNCFAVFGTDNISGIDHIATSDCGEMSVYATSAGDIIVNGEYSQMRVYDIYGRATASTSLAPGIYIVSVDGKPHKVAVPCR